MATKEEIELILKKEITYRADRRILQDESIFLKNKHQADVQLLKDLRKKGDGLVSKEQIQALRQKIGPEIKLAANIDRKLGNPVESVY
jgi:hypothetical protein